MNSVASSEIYWEGASAFTELPRRAEIEGAAVAPQHRKVLQSVAIALRPCLMPVCRKSEHYEPSSTGQGVRRAGGTHSSCTRKTSEQCVGACKQQARRCYFKACSQGVHDEALPLLQDEAQRMPGSHRSVPYSNSLQGVRTLQAWISQSQGLHMLERTG